MAQPTFNERGGIGIPLPWIVVELEHPEAFDVEGADVRARQAVERAALVGADYVRGLWIRTAQLMGVHESGEYIAGIRDARVDRMNGPSADPDGVDVDMLIVNEAKHAGIVEDGHEAFHLPSRVDWAGGHVKFGKNGPYLSIPFRHTAFATPEQLDDKGYTTASRRQMMPKDVYEDSKALRYTRRLNVGPIKSDTGKFIAFDRYKWGGRLDRGDVRTGFVSGPGGAYEERRSERRVAGGLTNPAWQTSKFQGLFKAGTKGHSQYMTIRTMTPNSKGWNIPAMLGKGVARAVAASLPSDPNLQAIMGEALEQAILDLGGG